MLGDLRETNEVERRGRYRTLVHASATKPLVQPVNDRALAMVRMLINISQTRVIIYLAASHVYRTQEVNDWLRWPTNYRL